MINFLFCTALPQGASKVDRTRIFDGFYIAHYFFHIWPDSVLIFEMNDVNNVIYNNFEYHDQPLKSDRGSPPVGLL